MNRAKTAAAAVAAGAAATLAAACGTTATTAPSAPGTSAAPSSAGQSQKTQVGNKCTIKAEDGTTYDVTLMKVAQNATPGSQFETPSPNRHLAATEFRITATTKVDENANASTTITGSNDQKYDPVFSAVAEGTNFSDGNVKLQPGSSAVGWVTFEIPNGVTVAKVTWTAAAGLSSARCDWAVS